MYISIDVGYSQVKAISQNGKKILFPAVKADIAHDPTDGMFKQLGHHVKIKTYNSPVQEILVGEGALRSLNATATLAREKSPEIHDIFILAAAYLCGASGFTDLAVGLPLAYYRFQKDELKHRLERISSHLILDDGPERYINISKVSVFPQGVGVLLSMPEIARTGKVAVIDIGYYTTDYLLFNIIDGSPVPIPELCGSLDEGIHLSSRSISTIYQEKTGALAPKFLLNDLIEKEAIYFNGKLLDLETEYKNVLKRNAEQITQSILAAWSQQSDNISQTILAGGGSLLLKDYLHFPNITMPDDPVFANTEGFLTMLKYKEKDAKDTGAV